MAQKLTPNIKRTNKFLRHFLRQVNLWFLDLKKQSIVSHHHAARLLVYFRLPYLKKKSRQKKTNFFASDAFFAEYFFTDYLFYQRLIFNDEYSYQHLFYKRKHLVFSNLKIPLIYLEKTQVTQQIYLFLANFHGHA